MRPLFPTRRLALLALSACALAHTPLHAQSTDYPNKPVRFINAWAPGGPADVLARLLGDALQTASSSPSSLKTSPAQPATLAPTWWPKSPADGYTVMFGIDTTFTINPQYLPHHAPSPGDLCKPLMVLGCSGMMVVAHPSTGFKSLSDMVAMGKAKGVNFVLSRAAAAPATWPPRYWVTPRA